MFVINMQGSELAVTTGMARTGAGEMIKSVNMALRDEQSGIQVLFTIAGDEITAVVNAMLGGVEIAQPGDPRINGGLGGKN